MPEIARKTIRNGTVVEVYSLDAPQDGYIVLDCRHGGSAQRDTFAIPVEIAGWLKESIPTDGAKPMRSFDAGVDFATRALRLLAHHPDIRTLSGTSAILAAADLLAGGSVDEADRPDPVTWPGPIGAKVVPIMGAIDAGKVVPMGGGIVRRFSP